jgi:hypothetical protein
MLHLKQLNENTRKRYVGGHELKSIAEVLALTICRLCLILKFGALESLAQRLASTLGVGKIKNADLKNGLLGFVREGIRFAFSLDSPNSEELFLGARLPFLRLLAKYIVLVRANTQQLSIIREQFNQKEDEVRSHPDFENVLANDIEAMELFRKAGKLGEFLRRRRHHRRRSLQRGFLVCIIAREQCLSPSPFAQWQHQLGPL